MTKRSSRRARTQDEIRAEYRKICDLLKKEDDDSVLYGVHMALFWVLNRCVIAPSVIGERVYAKSSKPPIE